MNKKIRNLLHIIFIVLNVFNSIFAQIPKNNSVLHYTSVYFEDSLVNSGNTYKLFLGLDSLFKKPILLIDTIYKKLPAFHVYKLNWATTYYWRVDAYKDGKIAKQGEIHKFSIMTIKASYMDTVRLKVIKNIKNKNNGGFIVFDNCRTIFDREGNPVWTLPLTKDIIDFNTVIRDLKITKDNTLTFLTLKTPIEIDFEGGVLWKGIKPLVIGKDTIKYHHDFKKDNEGNYWVLGNRIVYRKLLKKLEDNIVRNEDKVLITDSGIFRGCEMGLLMKFNKDNQLLWMWDANNYLKDVDLNYKLSGNGFPSFSSHMNAFSFNEKMDEVCIGFRDLSRIVKVNVKTGKVISSYGEKYPSGDAKYADNTFFSQHDCSITKANSILIFSNNTLKKEPSSVIELDGNNLNNNPVLWQFNLNFDSLTDGRSERCGNVTDLKNDNLLVCAGTLNRTFEITRKHEIVWDAFIQCKVNGDTNWTALKQYRSSFIPKIPIYQFIPVVEKTETKNNKVKKIKVVINNTGNSTDSYILKVFDKNQKVMIQKLTKQVIVNNNCTTIIDVPIQLKDKSAFTISITSNSLPNRVKFLASN